MAFNVLTGNIEKTIEAVNARGIQAELVQTGAEALARLTSLIPQGASVMTGGSLTLTQIGLDDLLISRNHPWKNLKDDILAEKDFTHQAQLRRESTLADYYLGSVQAIVESGELVIASGSGSQLPAYAYSSKNVIWVAGVQKIVPDFNAAMERVREYALPIEDQKMKALGFPGSAIGKLLIFERESARYGRNIHLILVNEVVGV